ncbi:hypothetical protein EON62_05505, partial [archaeon]
REIELLSTLHHENIVQYLGMAITETQSLRVPLTSMGGAGGGGAAPTHLTATIMIFLEQATSGSVKDMIAEYGALPEPLVARYMRDMLHGLSYLHSKGILHRDIKPGNILLSSGVAKLADFGCSKLHPVAVAYEAMEHATGVAEGSGAPATAHSDLENTISGTVAYMPPEALFSAIDDPDADAQRDWARARRDRKPSARARARPASGSPVVAAATSGAQGDGVASKPPAPPRPLRTTSKGATPSLGFKGDVWSLGITCLEMLQGRHVFSGPGQALLHLCLEQRLPDLPATLSTAARAFLQAALALDPVMRASVDDLLHMDFVQCLPDNMLSPALAHRRSSANLTGTATSAASYSASPAASSVGGPPTFASPALSMSAASLLPPASSPPPSTLRSVLA